MFLCVCEYLCLCTFVRVFSVSMCMHVYEFVCMHV